jgi:hypothetical protein
MFSFEGPKMWSASETGFVVLKKVMIGMMKWVSQGEGGVVL